MSVDSLSKIAFDDGLFRDEADLNGFVRWILRCQAKREAGTFKNGVANGYAENNPTKEVRRWKARGRGLTEEEKNELLAKAEKNRYAERGHFAGS